MKKDSIIISAIIFNDTMKAVLNKKQLIYDFDNYNLDRKLKNEQSLSIKDYIQVLMLYRKMECIENGINGVVII